MTLNDENITQFAAVQCITDCIHLKAVEDAGLQRRWLVVTEALMQTMIEVLNCESETCINWILTKCLVQGKSLALSAV